MDECWYFQLGFAEGRRPTLSVGIILSEQGGLKSIKGKKGENRGAQVSLLLSFRDMTTGSIQLHLTHYHQD